MSETATTEAPTTPTEGDKSTEAAATSLLTSTETADTTQQQQTETPAEGTAETTTTEEAKPEGAPESYDFKAPEGKEYDAAVLEPFAAAAKEANLTQDAAQKILDKMAPALAERQTARVKEVQDGWAQASRTDKEFGGDKLPESLAIAKKAVDTYASPEMKTLLETTGLGSNPEVIRFMVKVGQTIKEDGFVAGAARSEPVEVAKRLYDNTK